MVKKTKKKYLNKTVPLRKEARSNTLKKISLIIMFVLSILMVSVGGYLYLTTSSQHAKVVEQQHNASTDELMRKMKQMLDEEKTRLASIPPTPAAEHNTTSNPNTNQTIPSNESAKEPHVFPETNQSVPVAHLAESNVSAVEDEDKNHDRSEVQDYQRNLKDEKGVITKPTVVIHKKYPAGTTPKLAIVLDDVSFPWQTRLIKEIPYKVTPSFFPPTKGHPETVRLSHEFEFAMIHLPLESKHYSRPEVDTLNITDGIDVIEKRIKRIKAWFPQIKYYNNHTGGSYTADYDAMDRLIRVMKENGLSFVDSRTIGSSKAPAICKKYGMFLYSRDVFLDNSLEKPLIRAQLRQAVAKAKKNGYAIAIGHPHKNTLDVLKNSTDLLEGIDLVYLKDL